jgi:hypothetical protein
VLENSFLYAGNLEEEIREISELAEKADSVEQKDSFSVECSPIFTIYCC